MRGAEGDYGVRWLMASITSKSAVMPTNKRPPIACYLNCIRTAQFPNSNYKTQHLNTSVWFDYNNTVYHAESTGFPSIEFPVTHILQNSRVLLFIGALAVWLLHSIQCSTLFLFVQAMSVQ